MEEKEKEKEPTTTMTTTKLSQGSNLGHDWTDGALGDLKRVFISRFHSGETSYIQECNCIVLSN